MRKLLSTVTLLLLASCANPYSQFYKGKDDARTLPAYEPVQADLKIYSTDNFDRDVKALTRKGYQPIGQSSFNASSSAASEFQLRQQAQSVGAHVVLFSSRYTHTESGAAPLILPQTTTSFSTGAATAYGPGGVVNAYGNSTTTTYGSQTMMMPYSVNRSDFNAVFLIKVRSRVGIHAISIDDDTRRRLETNAGVKVDVVTEGTTAYQADVFPGDIVLTVGGESIQSLEHYYKLLDKYEGRSVVFKFDRDGKRLEKQIEIRSLVKSPQ